ncbi:MAG TPA: glycosyltransferase [Patescibacteria group bacterium]
MNKPFSGKNFIVATHFLIYSASQALRDYLRKEDAKLLYISHPLPGVNPDRKEHSYAEISKSEKISEKFSASLRFNFLPLAIFYEILLTLKWVYLSNQVYEVYIGVDNINAFEGILLKKLGKVKKVVYYTIDYFPMRYSNKLLNSLYHWLDKFCVKNADETWNVSSQMVLARESHNAMDRKIYNRQFTVPIGVWYEKTKRVAFSKINSKKLVFVGHLVSHMGLDLILKSIPLISKKNPTIEVDIIGGGEELENLKALAQKLKIEKYITFYGWVRDRDKLEKIMQDAAVGLATFNTEILDEKVKNADPMKIKDYMLLGMPVILTNAVLPAQKIADSKSGIVVQYNPSDLAKAVIYLLENKKRLEEYRQNALQYVKQFDYNKLFAENLERVLAR